MKKICSQLHKTLYINFCFKKPIVNVPTHARACFAGVPTFDPEFKAL